MVDPESIRLLALQQVWKDRNKKSDVDIEFLLRQKMRYYSKAFHTPLHEVEDLPIDDVLLAVWEDEYESVADEDLEEIRAQAITTQSQAARRREEMAAAADQGRAALARQQALENAKSMDGATKEVFRSAKDAIKLLERFSAPDPDAPLTERPSEIEFTFSDDWAEDDLLAVGPPPKKDE